MVYINNKSNDINIRKYKIGSVLSYQFIKVARISLPVTNQCSIHPVMGRSVVKMCGTVILSHDQLSSKMQK